MDYRRSSSSHLPGLSSGGRAVVTRGVTGVELVAAGGVADKLVQTVLVTSSSVPLAGQEMVVGTPVEFCS